MADWIGVLGTPLDVSGGILTIQLSQVLSFGADITCISARNRSRCSWIRETATDDGNLGISRVV